MKNLSSAKPTVLMAAIFAISVAAVSGCSNSDDTKATDRVEEAAAQARVQALEARATELKGKMPAATDGNAGATDAAATSGKPVIKMPDMAQRYVAAYKLPIIPCKNYPIMWVINSTVPAVTWVMAPKPMPHLGTI